MEHLTAKDRIVFPLDVASQAKAHELLERVGPHVGMIKVGLELMSQIGLPMAVATASTRHRPVFADGKLLDIPNTVAGAARAYTSLGVDAFNLHCTGGVKMMEAAKKAVDEVMASKDAPTRRPKLLGVTILTSLDFEDLCEMGFGRDFDIADPAERAEFVADSMAVIVKTLALQAQDCGLDGVIASPKEIKAIRRSCDPDLEIWTPGVRRSGSNTHDQSRVDTPFAAIAAGATRLVIGRDLYDPAKPDQDPAANAQAVVAEIEAGLKARAS